MSPWEDRAACRNGQDDLFFPPGITTMQNYLQYADAIAICNVCPVKRECLEAAASLPNVCGVWGGVFLSSGSTHSSHNKRKIHTALGKL